MMDFPFVDLHHDVYIEQSLVLDKRLIHLSIVQVVDENHADVVGVELKLVLTVVNPTRLFWNSTI